MADEAKKKIMFSGGGTGGSVTPLLAVAAELLKDEPVDLYFVGSKHGPEKELVAAFNESLDESQKINFWPLSAGKWRRYFSLRNFFDLFIIAAGFFQAARILRRVQPDIVITAGSFVSVPLVWAANRQKIPVIIHQQDIRPGLANRLMASGARVVTVTFEKSLLDYGPKAVLIGNPSRDLSGYEAEKRETRAKYHINLDQPLVLAMGGGTGATALNELIVKALPDLDQGTQVIHLTGRGKADVSAADGRLNYQALEFVPNDEALRLMAAADLVVSRAGLGALTELAALSKATILIPMPNSHQEDNAALFARAEAALVLKQDELSAANLAREINRVLKDGPLRQRLGERLAKVIKPGAAAKMVDLIWEIISSHEKK